MRSRRRLVWLAVIVAVIGCIAAWRLTPASDPYHFLRALAPEERVTQTYAMVSGSPTPVGPGGYARSFNFSAPVRDVYECLAKQWTPEQKIPFSDGARAAYFTNPSGKTTALWLPSSDDDPKMTCSLIIWDIEPTWLERQMIAVNGWLQGR